MNLETGDIWKYHDAGHTICVATNGIVRVDGNAVMGRGIALEAGTRFPQLKRELGDKLFGGNHVYWFPEFRIITFPTKHHWMYDSDLKLIHKSAVQLAKVVKDNNIAGPIYLPAPGCGNGNLTWEQVCPAIMDVLDDNFTVVTL